jgi:hypothetical protein
MTNTCIRVLILLLFAAAVDTVQGHPIKKTSNIGD